MKQKLYFSAVFLLLFSAVLLCACGAREELSAPGAGEGSVVDLGALPDEGVPLADTPAVFTVQSPVASGVAVKQNSSVTVDYSNAKDGYIMASWTGGSAKVKILLKGPGGTQYQYNLRTDGRYETFPLSDGSGSYSVGVYKNIEGTQYSTVLGCTVDVKLADEFGPFLRPNQYVDFTADSRAVAKAAELCAGAADNLEKVGRVYEFVINNVAYDKEKAKTVQSGYLPDIDETLASGKGICFDYAALMTAMLRSQNVPAKLIVGYTGSIYHAWINVWSEQEGWLEAKIYFDGRQWKLMDPTFASSGNGSDSIQQYIGNGDNYKAKYQY